MKPISGRDFARLAEQHDWRLLRVAGSHHIYGKPGSVVRLSIRSMAIARSNWACCGTWQSWPASTMS
jgi:predicted RNA binding protein YcfA (HicA-like mRNA interferase family)